MKDRNIFERIKNHMDKLSEFKLSEKDYKKLSDIEDSIQYIRGKYHIGFCD